MPVGRRARANPHYRHATGSKNVQLRASSAAWQQITDKELPVHHTDAGADAETGSYADVVMRIALLDGHCLHATSLPITPIFFTDD